MNSGGGLDTVRILLADSHAIVRQGLKRIIESRPELSVVAEACSGVEAVKLARRERPDVAILEVALKELNGLEALAQIRRRCPDTAVLMLSAHADSRYVLGAMRRGARGYILKDSSEEEFVGAIFKVRAGERSLSPAVSGLVQQSEAGEARNEAPPADRYDLLTARERHIHQLLAEGNNNKDIASRLGLSLHTVETHRARIMDKLGLRSAAQLVIGAFRRGIVS